PDFDPGFGPMTGISPLPRCPAWGLATPPLPQDPPVAKEIIHCKAYTAFPLLPPCVEEARNLSYTAVVVGGLPENATGQLIVEVLGEVAPIKKRNFCHEFNVDKALFLILLSVTLWSLLPKYQSISKTNVIALPTYTHAVEWASSVRWEARKENEDRKQEEDLFRPPSPPPVHYSEHQCSQLGDENKDDNRFPEAARVLLTWLERGEVNRANANNLYSVIRSSQRPHPQADGREKAIYSHDIKEGKKAASQLLSKFHMSVEEIVSVFNPASRQTEWDHFSKAQQKLVFLLPSKIDHVINKHSESLLGDFQKGELHFKDNRTEPLAEQCTAEMAVLASQAEALKEENSLHCQLDAYRNGVELLKQEQGKKHPMSSEEDTTHSEQLSFLQQALHAEEQHQQLLRDELKEQSAELEKNLKECKLIYNKARGNVKKKKTLPSKRLRASERDGETVLETINLSPVKLSKQSLVLFSCLCSGMRVHPFGASIEYVCSYLQHLDNKCNTSEVEALLARLLCTHGQEITGISASLEKRWKFCGIKGMTLA
uniref:Ecto-NOX disulfide-thiol exchanger 1/2 domain-containing protein n=1 Tax=Gasterosteus aculeatus TaxID=69293 RepID=G3PZU6_GASAC